MSSGHITFARCWSCQFGDCYDNPTPHPWMDDEDAEAAGIAWPLSDEDKAKHQCACACSGQAGHHVPLTPEQAKLIIDAVGGDTPTEAEDHG